MPKNPSAQPVGPLICAGAFALSGLFIGFAGVFASAGFPRRRRFSAGFASAAFSAGFFGCLLRWLRFGCLLRRRRRVLRWLRFGCLLRRRRALFSLSDSVGVDTSPN